MRTLACAFVAALLTTVAVAQEDTTPTHDLKQRWVKDFVYTAEETETVDSTIVFFSKQRDGSEARQAGGVTDKHTRTVTTTPVAFDETGATKLEVSVPRHTLLRTESPPGEAAARVVVNGRGVLNEAAWTEEWKESYWKRTPTKPGNSAAGQFPEEFKKAMLIRRHTRHHFLLPDDAVSVGATWKPKLDHLLEQYQRVTRGDEAPKVEVECKLESVEDGRAVLALTWKVEGVKPVKSDTGSFWKDDTKIKIEGTAKLTLHMAEQFVEKYESETTAKLDGSLWNSGEWLRAEATLKFSTTSATTKAAKAD
jgi:hypothetical protein